ncbi:MAG: MotA/TolQ/ExbB proton channel family protein [Candidatus Stahlbacteria bacterium]|nr:MotA/TolQ/ExbB proton channel family protein [Candidatus Stahlbacteria bacterium]
MTIGGVPLIVVMKISPIFDLLVICLGIFIWITFERVGAYKKKRMDRVAFMEEIRNALAKNKYESAIEYCANENKPLANMVKVGLMNRHRSPEDIAELMEATRMGERVGLEKFLGILGTMGNSSPFIGLLGTVIGIIRAFKLLEHAGAGGATTIMVGIAEALVTTAMGLLVAIPCVIAFNYFMGVVKNWYVEMEVVSKELMVELVSGGKAKAVKKA